MRTAVKITNKTIANAIHEANRNAIAPFSLAILRPIKADNSLTIFISPF
jgi:hypothetical protein